jgi:hypothetical protein
MSITDSKAEYGYLYYQNESRSKATLKETIVFNKLENFAIVLEDGDRSTRVEQRQIKASNAVLEEQKTGMLNNTRSVSSLGRKAVEKGNAGI